MQRISRRTLLKQASAAAVLPLVPTHAAAAENVPSGVPEATKPRRDLVLLLADFKHKERDLAAATLGAMSKAHGVEFEAYYAVDHGDGGIFSPHGSTLLGGRHEIPIGRALAEYRTTVVYLGSPHVFSSLVAVGAAHVLHADRALMAASEVSKAFGWPFPETAVAMQMNDLPAEIEDIQPYLTPEVVHRQAVAVALDSADSDLELLKKQGVTRIVTIGCKGKVPDSWARYGFHVEVGEEFAAEDTLYSVTYRVASRWVAQSKGIDLCEPIMAVHWLPFSIREDRLQMCSRPSTKEAIDGIVELARAWPDPVVYGRWGGGGVKGVGDFGLFPLFRKGLSVEVSEPGRPVLTLFSKSPVPIAQPEQSCFDLEPSDDQLREWAKESRILATYVLHSGELSHDDAVVNFIEYSGTRKVPIGMGVHWERYAFEPWSMEATQIPQSEGGALGLVEPVLHSTGHGIMAEREMDPDLVVAQMKDARARIARIAGDRFVPRGVYCFLDADMKNWDSPAPQLWKAIGGAGFEYVISSVANGDNRVLHHDGNFIVLNMVGRRTDASPFVRHHNVEMPGLEQRLRNAGKPGWLIGVLDSPLYGYSPYLSSGHEWGFFVRISDLYDYLEKGARERNLILATPHTIARYARILVDMGIVQVSSSS